MQINGIGSNHGSDMHHVTNCRHNHGVSKKQDSAPMSSGSKQKLDPGQVLEQRLESEFSLTDWMKNIFARGKKLLGQIWGSSDEGIVKGENPVSAEDMQRPEKVVQAAVAVQPTQTNGGIPYFSAIEDTGTRQQTLWQRIRIKFENVAGYLTRQFSFSNGSSFQTKQENTKEDLKREHYGKDNLKTDVWAMDESHLMDSYNSKGEYSRLAGEMLPKGTKDIRG